jgi:hypothetical protein
MRVRKFLAAGRPASLAVVLAILARTNTFPFSPFSTHRALKVVPLLSPSSATVLPAGGNPGKETYPSYIYILPPSIKRYLNFVKICIYLDMI